MPRPESDRKLGVLIKNYFGCIPILQEFLLRTEELHFVLCQKASFSFKPMDRVIIGVLMVPQNSVSSTANIFQKIFQTLSGIRTLTTNVIITLTRKDKIFPIKPVGTKIGK